MKTYAFTGRVFPIVEIRYISCRDGECLAGHIALPLPPATATSFSLALPRQPKVRFYIL